MHVNQTNDHILPSACLHGVKESHSNMPTRAISSILISKQTPSDDGCCDSARLPICAVQVRRHPLIGKMLPVTLLTFFPLRTEGPGSINIGWLGVHFALMSRWDHSPYQISVIFLRLTRLSTSQRYEPIKGVFHTATTRTRVLITSVPNMQSQGGQGEDCYIW